MGPTIIARNYADTLLELAVRNGGEAAVDEFATAIEAVAELLRDEPRTLRFLQTPAVDLDTKKRAVRQAFSGRVPEHFLRFLLVVLEKRRQSLLPQIAEEYSLLVDRRRDRVHAEITVAREPAPELRAEIVETLQRKLGKTVVPSFRVDEDLIAGVLVRVGDQIIDGSVRRRLGTLRRRLLEAPLPETQAVNSTL